MPFSTSSLALQHRIAVGEHGLLESGVLGQHVVLDPPVVQEIPVESRTDLTDEALGIEQLLKFWA